MGSAGIQGPLWGQAATDWAERQEPMCRPLWEAMFKAAEIGPGTRLLDAGCGSAGACVLAAELGATVSGLDAASSMIDIARRRLPQGDFHVGDMQELPFEDTSFDAVLSANSLQYTEDRVAALRELARVCDADGRVVVGLWSTADKVEFRVVFQAVRDALPAMPGGKGPFELSEPGVLEELIERGGLKALGSGEAACPFEYPNFDAFWQANVSAGPFQAALRSVKVDELKAAIRDAVLPHERADGSLHLANDFRYVVAVH